MIIDSENSKIIKQLKEINNKGYKTLILLGGVGVGKTYLAKEIMKPDYSISETSFKTQLTSGNLRLRKHEEHGADINKYPLEALSKKKTILFDDYGSASTSEAMIERMLYRLDQRIDSQIKKTIITSNLSLEEIEKKEERLFSRMCQDATIVVITGPDRRRLTAKIITT